MTSSSINRFTTFIVCAISFWISPVIANANEEKATDIIKLWPKDTETQGTKGMRVPKPDRGDGNIRLTNITVPSMRYFPALAKVDQGSVLAVILCPGGGYSHLSVTKMTSTAKWLNEQGISSFVLLYQVPKKRKEAFQDIQHAMRIVRSRALEWNIDPKRIGVMGS